MIFNVSDICWIILDSVQLFIIFGAPVLSRSLYDAEVPSPSLFRIVRLARLTRVLRLLRSDKLKDLSQLLQGIVAGILTLRWSIVALLLLVFVVALVCRELLGTKK